MFDTLGELQPKIVTAIAGHLLLGIAGSACIAEELPVEAGKLIAKMNADWESQRELNRPLRVSLLKTNRRVPREVNLARKDVRALLSRVTKLRNQKSPETFEAALKEMIIKFDPSLKGQPTKWSSISIVLDGKRRRVESLSQFGLEVQVETEDVNIRKRAGLNPQIVISPPRRGGRVMDFDDLVHLPNISDAAEVEWKVAQANKRTTISSEYETYLIDDENSFVHKHTATWPTKSDPARGVRSVHTGHGVFQYDPVEVSKELVLPRYRFNFVYSGNWLNGFSIIQLVDAEVIDGDVPDVVFAVSAPAGAEIVDQRVKPTIRATVESPINDVAKLLP